MDIISTLPDDILGHILSFLPTKQAASTSLLSKRWRDVFVLVPHLDLVYNDDFYNKWRKFVDDDDDLDASLQRYMYDKRKKFMDFLDSLLSRQGMSLIKKLTLKLCGFGRNQTRVQNWICNVLERGVVDLHLSYIKNSQFLSSLIFKNNTLVKLRLEDGFKIKLSQDVYLPKLKTLCLLSVDFDGVHDDVFEILLPRCPVLEELVLKNHLCVKVHISVSSRSLKNNTLVKLRLEDGFIINLSQDVYLPKLKTLCLRSVIFDGVHDDVFEILLPRCPVLEELVLENRLWVKGHISVSSRSLKKLIIRFLNTQTISLDVPNLVYLELSCSFGVKCVNVKLDSLVEARLCPSVRGSDGLVPLDTIDIIIRIRNVMVLQLSNDALEMFYYSDQELPMFDNLVRLCILSNMTHGWQILPLLIKNSPNLETLIFKGLKHCETTDCGDVCVCTGSKKNTSSCLSSSRVKVLEIWFYNGTKKELNQMKHFLEKLSCLEMVKIKVVNNLKVTKYIQQLLKLPRASSNCKIQAIF